MKLIKSLRVSILLIMYVPSLATAPSDRDHSDQKYEQEMQELDAIPLENDHKDATKFVPAAVSTTAVFNNLLVQGDEFIRGNLNVGGSTNITGNLVVNGSINSGSSNLVSGPASSTPDAVPRYADTTGSVLKDSSVLVDDAGNITINGITNNGNTVTWPSIVGPVNTFLASDGAGNLIYATPAGSGNVNLVIPFTADNRLVRTDLPNGSNSIQESGITLDDSNNITGVNALTATTLTTSTLSATSITGALTGNVTGNLSGNATTATTAINFSGSLAGDVTGTQSATVVSTVGGQTAANVASATIAANAATDANTASTIVKRDSSGNFSAGTITANLVGNATTATSATTATNFSGSLSGDVTGTQSATVVSTVGGQTAANVAAATALANAATANNTASTIVRRDASGNFSAGTITASLTGAASLNVLKSGDVMTGALTVPAGTTSTPSLNFTASTTTGLSANSNNLSLSTAGAERMKISSSGVVSINGLNSAGVVHTDASGNLSTSTIVNADISSSAAITDTKLATITTAGKVADSATTATPTNTPSTIVERDASGNFNAGTITANLVGNATTATTATNFSGSLAGDVTGTQSATVVSTVGGQTAANVAAATVLANAATANNTASTIVRRDASGNFSAGTITASLVGNVTGNLSGNATTATSATTATNFSGALSGDVTGTQSATVVSTVGGQSAANVAAATVLANAATANNTASAIVRRDASGNFSAGTITASLTGAASLNVLKSGDVMTGALTVPAGTTSTPSLNFTASTTTGLSANSNNLSLSTAGAERMKISSSGVVSINGLNSAGVVHTDASGNLSTSTIVNNDISASAAITDTKLATITTAGKVADSATTATPTNTPSTIVERDASGNFNAGTITAALTGAASLNVLKAGDTMTGALVLPAGTTASPSLKFTGSTNTGITAQTANTLSFDTSGVERMSVSDTAVTVAAALIVKSAYVDQSTQVVTPVNSQTITVNSGVSILLLTNTTGVSSVTVLFPPNPLDGQLFSIVLGTTSPVTFAAFNGGTGGATVVSPLTALNAITTPSATANGNAVTYLYNAAANSWYRYSRG